MKLWLVLLLAAGLVLVRISFTLFGPAGDIYFLALVVGSAVSWERLRRRHGGDVMALAEQLAASEAAKPTPVREGADPQSEPEPTTTYLVFTYPTASRLRAWLAALVCGFFGVGFLLALILQPTDDPGNSWLLFGLGVLWLGGLLWSAWQLSWIGASLAVSPVELVHRSPGGHLTRLPWETLRRITRRRFPVSLTLWGAGQTQIRVYSPLAGDDALLHAIGTGMRTNRPHAS